LTDALPQHAAVHMHTGAAMKSLLDPSFRYVPSIRTDIRKTFARIRKEAQLPNDGFHSSPMQQNVSPLFSGKKRVGRGS
jgi:hypothetical protein